MLEDMTEMETKILVEVLCLWKLSQNDKTPA